MKQTIIEYLQSRNFINTLSSPQMASVLEKPTSVYVGFDPTASSLHLGNLIGIMALAHFQRFGHTPVVVLGGTTGRIGDPSGKSIERPLLDIDTIDKNVASIRAHFDRVLDFSGKTPRPIICNNDQWYRGFTVVDFLRDVGKHFRLGPMLAKDTVKSRLASEEGISYTEFSYQIIQAYDFYHLHRDLGVSVQMGGSDQWGNITAGIEFTRKMTGEAVYGLTWPLLTRSDGKKFGKTAEGAIWLCADKCSPYQFYQYLYRMPDADVIHMLKMLTFLELEEIAAIEKQMHQPGYVPNTAQRLLAEEVTRIVHGAEGVKIAQRVSASARPGKEAKLDRAALENLADGMLSTTVRKEEVLGRKFADLAVIAGLLSSKGEANRLIKSGGAYLNNQRLADTAYVVKEADLVEGAFVLLGAGKKKKALIKVE